MLSQIPAALTQDRKGTLSGPRSFACRHPRRRASAGLPSPATALDPGRGLRRAPCGRPEGRGRDGRRLMPVMEPEGSLKSPSYLNPQTLASDVSHQRRRWRRVVKGHAGTQSPQAHPLAELLCPHPCLDPRAQTPGAPNSKVSLRWRFPAPGR